MKTSACSIAAALALSFCSVPASAQWNPDPSVNLLVSGPDAVSQDLPYAAAAPDGSSYVSWLSWENATACLKLQHLGKDGAPLFQEGGIYVSKNPTPTWSSGFDITCDSEGNAVIVYSDKRNGLWQAYAYKVSPAGEMLWNDGVLLATNNQESCLNPKVVMTDAGNVIIGFQSLYESHNSIKVVKLTPSGSKAWGGFIELQGTNGLYNLVAGVKDSFYVSYLMANEGSLAVMRYTANGEEAWTEPTVTDNGQVIVGTEPTAAPDGNGGVLVGWRHAVSEFSSEGRLQGIDSSGAVLWPESRSFTNVPQACADTGGNIYVAYTKGQENADNLFVSKYDMGGEDIWNTKALLKQEAYRVSIYGIRSVEDDVAVVYRNAGNYNDATIGYAHIDHNGDPVVTDGNVSTMPGDKGMGSLVYTGDGQLVLAWGDNGSSKGGGRIYAQNVNLDVAVGIEHVTDAGNGISRAFYSDGVVRVPGAEGHACVYSMGGTMIWSGAVSGESLHTGYLLPGIYLVKTTVGSVKLLAN